MTKDQELNIELNADIAQGSYSNLAIITHSSSEFIIDFIRLLPGVPKPQVTNRIIMTAEHSKRLMLALQDNITNFESQHGEIKLDIQEKEEINRIPLSIGNNKAQA